MPVQHDVAGVTHAALDVLTAWSRLERDESRLSRVHGRIGLRTSAAQTVERGSRCRCVGDDKLVSRRTWTDVDFPMTAAASRPDNRGVDQRCGVGRLARAVRVVPGLLLRHHIRYGAFLVVADDRLPYTVDRAHMSLLAWMALPACACPKGTVPVKAPLRFAIDGRFPVRNSSLYVARGRNLMSRKCKGEPICGIVT